MVLLLPQGPQVPDGDAHQPGHRQRLLEGDGQRQGDLPRPRRPRRHEEDARLLHGPRTTRRQDAMGDARVPPRGKAAAAPPPRRQGRMGRLPRVQQRLGGQAGWPNGAAARRHGSGEDRQLPRLAGRHPWRRDAAAHGLPVLRRRPHRLEGRRWRLRRRGRHGQRRRVPTTTSSRQGGAAAAGGPQLPVPARGGGGAEPVARRGGHVVEAVPGAGRPAATGRRLHGLLQHVEVLTEIDHIARNQGQRLRASSLISLASPELGASISSHICY